MGATVKEVLEQLYAQRAIEEHRLERLEAARSSTPTTVHSDGPTTQAMDGTEINPASLPTGPPRARTVRGAAAAAIADKPHFVEGWEEWNQNELAETDPAKESIRVRT